MVSLLKLAEITEVSLKIPFCWGKPERAPIEGASLSEPLTSDSMLVCICVVVL